MIKRRVLSLSIALLMLCSVTACEQMKSQCNHEAATAAKATGAKPDGTIKLGYLICNSKEETVVRFAPVATWLGRKLGKKVHMYPVHTYEVAEDIKKYGFQFMKVNSIVYIQLKHKIDLQFIAGEKRGPLGRFTTGTIVARKGSGIKTIKDLKGKKFAFGPMFAPFGYLVQYDMMLKAGINPEEDLQYYAIPWGAYKHNKAVYGVTQLGIYDAASGPMLDLIAMSESGKIRWGDKYPVEDHDFNVIAESAPAPYCTFACTKEADPELAKTIKKYLLELTEKDLVEMDPEWLEVEGMQWDNGGFLRSGEVLNVCKAGLITGYEDGSDSDYDVLREMAKNAKLDPYSEYSD